MKKILFTDFFFAKLLRESKKTGFGGGGGVCQEKNLIIFFKIDDWILKRKNMTTTEETSKAVVEVIEPMQTQEKSVFMRYEEMITKNKPSIVTIMASRANLIPFLCGGMAYLSLLVSIVASHFKHEHWLLFGISYLVVLFSAAIYIVSVWSTIVFHSEEQRIITVHRSRFAFLISTGLVCAGLGDLFVVPIPQLALFCRDALLILMIYSYGDMPQMSDRHALPPLRLSDTHEMTIVTQAYLIIVLICLVLLPLVVPGNYLMVFSCVIHFSVATASVLTSMRLRMITNSCIIYTIGMVANFFVILAMVIAELHSVNILSVIAWIIDFNSIAFMIYPAWCTILTLSGSMVSHNV